MNRTHQLTIKKVLQKHGVPFAYLFGSHAQERALRVSDIDIAVFFGNGTPASRFKKQLKLAHDLQEYYAPQRVDLVVLDDIRSTTLRYDIIQTGAILYSNDEGKRLDFELRAFNDYEDFSPFLKSYNRQYMATAI